MFARVHRAGETKGGNKGSCTDLVSYLDKEKDNGLNFFSHTEDDISIYEVISSIDNNKFKMGKDEAKFYMLTLNPSERELQHLIGRDIDNLDELPVNERKELFVKIEDFTKQAMDKYAQNFDRPTVKSGDDLMYFARIETERLYKKDDILVKDGLKKIGEKKEGLQVHVHVLVSRKSKDGKVKLSPNAKSAGNQWNLKDRGNVQRGFSHDKWKGEVQEVFNQNFNYKPLEKEEYKSKVIPKENALREVTNADLKSILENHTITSTNQVDYLMKQKGYESKVYRGTHYFKKEDESFSIKNDELKPFVDRLSDDKMKDILQRFNLMGFEKLKESYNYKGITIESAGFTDKKTNKEVNYFIVHDNDTKSSISLSRLKNFAFDNHIKMYDRDLHLDAIDNVDLREILSNKGIKNVAQVEAEMTTRGYKCINHEDRTVFSVENKGYSIQNKHLNALLYGTDFTKTKKKDSLRKYGVDQTLNKTVSKVKNALSDELTGGQFNNEVRVLRKTKYLFSDVSLKTKLINELRGLVSQTAKGI